VAGIDAEIGLLSPVCGTSEAVQNGPGPLRAVRSSVWLGVQFDPFGPDLPNELHLMGVEIHEYAEANGAFCKPSNDLP